MNIQKLGQHALAAHFAIFNDMNVAAMPTGAQVPVVWTPRHTVRKVEITRFNPFAWTVQKFERSMDMLVRRVTFLEQNPARASRFGILSQQGYEIMWVLFNDEFTGMGTMRVPGDPTINFYVNLHGAVRDLEYGITR